MDQPALLTSHGSRTVRYTYNGDLLVDVTDPRGNSTTMTYDNKGHGLLTAMQRPEGNSPFTQTFDTEQRVVTQTDATGALWNFAYGDGVTTMTGPDGTTEEHHHSPARELRKRVDQEENDFDVLYDNKGRAIAVIDRLGDTTRTTYDDASGLPRSITGADGSTTSYEWNATTIEGITFRDLVRVDHPDGSTSRMTYNAAGYLTSLVDRRGKTTSFTYNDDRQLITLTTPDGETTRQTHGPTGLRDSIIGPDGRTTVIKYDALDRPIAIESPDGTTDQIAYDANNNRTLLTDAAGESTGYEYDRNNNVTAVIDAEGQRTTFLYDVLDRRIASIDAEGRRTAQIYDNRGRIVAVANGAGDTLRLMYDRAGRLLSITDADGKSLVREIDAEGITTAIIDQKGNRSTFATDQMGRPTSITDPLGRATTVAYNSLGQVTSLTDPIGQIQDWNYDNGGQMTEWTTSGGITASYDYSDLGFLASLTDPLGNRWSFVQDANGRLTSERDPLDNEIGYRYDDAGDLAAFMLPGDLGTVTFVRDARGNATEIGYPDGSSERFGYDRNGRTTSGTGFAFSYDRSGLVDTVNGIAIGRDDAGRIDRLVYGPGKEITYRYDNRGFLAEVSDWIGGTTSMQYDETGKITALTRPNGLTTNWTYDAAGYLTGIAEGDRARITLQQDELGRTTSAERSGYLMPMITNDTTSRTYNAATQIAEASYDKLGRLLDDDARTYQWDAASRVTTMSETGGTSSTWQYDARGNVVARTTNGETTASIRNYGLGRPTLAIERGNNGSDERYYVHAPSGHLLYSIDAADDDRRFYHYDEVGSTLLLSDESGTITDRYAYTPYGASAGREGESPNRFTFVGAFGVEQESADGLYRMGARLYDASSARFISRDPARLVHPKQLNPYRYALGNPLSYIDGDGRKETLAQRETREIRSMDPESGLGQLAKVLVGNSAPRTPDLTVDVMGSDGDDNEITIGNNDVKSKLDDDDIDGLNDREHLFGSGDIASTYTPGQARKRIRSVSGDASGPGHLPNSNPSGNKPGAPSGSITESPFFGQPVPGPFDSVKRAFVFPKGLFAPPKGSGGALSRDVQDYLPLVIKLFLEGLSDPTHPFSFTAPPLTQREAPTKIFIEFNGQLLPVILPKGAIILEFPKVLVTPNPGDDDPDELGDGEEIL